MGLIAPNTGILPHTAAPSFHHMFTDTSFTIIVPQGWETFVSKLLRAEWQEIDSRQMDLSME
jgi:hypothetical protein